MLLDCGIGEDSSVPRSPRRSNPAILKEIGSEYLFIGRTDAEADANNLATWCEELTP